MTKYVGEDTHGTGYFIGDGGVPGSLMMGYNYDNKQTA